MSATRLRSGKHLSEREPLQKVTKKEASNLEEEPAMTAAVLDELKSLRTDLKGQIKNLSDSLKDFQRNANERLTHIESVISKMDDIDGMKMKQQELEQGLASMKESMDALNTTERELERLRNNNEELKEKLDNLELFSRDFNIRLLGVNEDKGRRLHGYHLRLHHKPGF